MFAIVDIETNGLNNRRGKITEIAIFKHNGKKVVDSFETLINPESSIPFEISRLTGITDSMVLDAPKFYEVAKSIHEFTQDCIFVAHNVNFDYRFIQKEFKDLGFDFRREKICTVRQSRLLIPGKKSYSLGNLCKELGIANHAMHRAAGDAKATVKLLEHLLSIDPDLGLTRKKEDQLSKYLHPKLDLNKILEAPKKTGVYYLKNEKDEVIYVGKSINIRTRLYHHLRQPKTDKAIKMHTQVADIDFELTGSELVALLIENEEIKRLKPRFNSALKRSSFPYSMAIEKDLFGYLHLKIEKNNEYKTSLAAYSTQAKAKAHLEKLVREFDLCLGLCGLQKCGNGCVSRAVRTCRGAALYAETSDSYNQRVETAISKIHPISENVLLIENSADSNRLWAILIHDGDYAGLGQFDPSFSENIEFILDSIKMIKPNPDSRHIISSYLRNKKVKRIINLN